MASSGIEADIAAIEQNSDLWSELHFASRLEALDYLEFHVIDHLASLLPPAMQPGELAALQQRAQRLKQRLEAIDLQLFQRLRAGIRAGQYRSTALLELARTYVGQLAEARPRTAEIGYDALDTFINDLLGSPDLPAETTEREPEMVFYQQTPARIVIELAATARLTPGDVFVDIGAGLGQVPLLVSLLSGARASGIEIEPAYCAYARQCAADLGLADVVFNTIDARRADYSTGTVFFMFTPFGGQMLQEVLARLRAEAGRGIRLFTYGPCTLAVARQPWLTCSDSSAVQVYRLCEFRS